MDFYPNEIICEGCVKLRIEAVGGDLDKARDKYPESFLDEMARQLTPAICAAMSVRGIENSSIDRRDRKRPWH